MNEQQQVLQWGKHILIKNQQGNLARRKIKKSKDIGLEGDKTAEWTGRGVNVGKRHVVWLNDSGAVYKIHRTLHWRTKCEFLFDTGLRGSNVQAVFRNRTDEDSVFAWLDNGQVHVINFKEKTRELVCSGSTAGHGIVRCAIFKDPKLLALCEAEDSSYHVLEVDVGQTKVRKAQLKLTTNSKFVAAKFLEDRNQLVTAAFDPSAVVFKRWHIQSAPFSIEEIETIQHPKVNPIACLFIEKPSNLYLRIICPSDFENIDLSGVNAEPKDRYIEELHVESSSDGTTQASISSSTISSSSTPGDADGEETEDDEIETSASGNADDHQPSSVSVTSEPEAISLCERDPTLTQQKLELAYKGLLQDITRELAKCPKPVSNPSSGKITTECVKKAQDSCRALMTEIDKRVERENAELKELEAAMNNLYNFRDTEVEPLRKKVEDYRQRNKEHKAKILELEDTRRELIHQVDCLRSEKNMLQSTLATREEEKAFMRDCVIIDKPVSAIPADLHSAEPWVILHNATNLFEVDARKADGLYRESTLASLRLVMQKAGADEAGKIFTLAEGDPVRINQEKRVTIAECMDSKNHIRMITK